MAHPVVVNSNNLSSMVSYNEKGNRLISLHLGVNKMGLPLYSGQPNEEDIVLLKDTMDGAQDG